MTNKEFFVKTFSKEMEITAVAVRALPDDVQDQNYKPDPKAKTAMEIIGHIIPHVGAMNEAAKSFVFNEEGKEFSNKEEAVEFLEKSTAGVLQDLKSVDDKTWEEKIVPFEYMGTKYFEAPMYEMYWMFLMDMIHHRGQLSTYYRPMGVRNPNLYGPTADDVQTG
ncbi:MAG TPA: DinB family protein [Ignavibacteria bacterium]|nr:DinB family protein [Ignavibacteria bacterium]HMR42000.1 DinB family protein [Ignavibacteria bacterium]